MKQFILLLLLLQCTIAFAQKNKDEGFRRTDPVSDELELFVKTHVEDHSPHEFSNMRLLPIYNYTEFGTNNFIEFAAIKEKGVKSMVIQSGVKSKEPVTKKLVLEEATFITIAEDDCKKALEKFDQLMANIEAAAPGKNEVVYADYTISDKLFVSFSTASPYGRTSRVYVYVEGRKHEMAAEDFVKVLKVFAGY